SADDFEDSELLYPYYRLKEEGIEVVVASFGGDRIRGKHGYSRKVDLFLGDVDPGEYDLLILPGGRAPERLGLYKHALRIAEHFFEKNKPVAAICHGQQILMSAGLVKGKRATSWSGIKDDLIAAGAQFENTEVVVDGNLITSRQPKDLPAFMREIVKKIKE
ncbi:MAG: type 1 glutamine amidotransferase domain-containing protein, partial [Candidatus Hydrothermarchaeales archaeon]